MNAHCVHVTRVSELEKKLDKVEEKVRKTTESDGRGKGDAAEDDSDSDETGEGELFDWRKKS